jgi:twitching motility protein PilT
MAGIDKFLALLTKYPADALVFEPDEKIVLRSGDQKRAVSAQAISQAQIQEIVQEILPADTTRITNTADGYEFEYRSVAGLVAVRVVRSLGTTRVEVRPQPAVGETPGVSKLVEVQANGTRPRIDVLFQKMIAQKCSDLHLTVASPPLFRKDGEMVALGETTPLAADALREILLEITPRLNRAEFEAHHDTDFSYEIPDVARFRANIFMDRRGIGGVFRLIPSQIPTAQDLGLPKAVLDFCSLQKGLVLVTGPTGSGKSTTLAAMIDYLNSTRTAHIITIEDPIEFVYPSKNCLVNQREVRTHTDGFKQALRAALREDPDIVLVGEMRDLETVAIAIETAETGHLVFGTLHTNTAPGAVDRIIDQFPPDRQAQIRTMLSESLRGVVAQTLVKCKGGGRAAAQEILIVTPAVSNLIREGKTFQIHSIMQTGRALGMTTMNDALLELVRSGAVDADEALSKAPNRTEFKSVLDRANGAAGAAGAKPAGTREAASA